MRKFLETSNELQLVYTRRAVKDIEALDVVGKKRLKKALEKFVNRPFYYAKKLTDSRLGEFRWRIGDYRVIFDCKKDKVIVLRVGHRREIYS